jgi:hypothetical protein
MPPILADLVKLSPESRAAFAAGAVERVFDLYTGAVASYRDASWDAITKVWDRASGIRIPDHAYQELTRALDEESGLYVEEGGPTVPYGAIRAVLYALRAAFLDDPEQAARAAKAASDEVNNAEQMRGKPAPAGLHEEQVWQRGWLQTVSNVDPREAREVFKRQEKAKPSWLIRWES